MSPIRQELHGYIDMLPDLQLEALKPIFTILVDEPLIIETDLTEEEKEIIRQGREEAARGTYVPWSQVH